ncbi:MAG: hypothetical protein C0592_05970 [Marinilabiliales bacterium]|nr:MAG: hypothetical protein C0592_05970 [Marinilabiliales bacterium]
MKSLYLFALLLSLLFVACGNSSSNDNENQSTDSTQVVEIEQIAFDTTLTDIGRLLAGMSSYSDSVCLNIQNTAVWKEHEQAMEALFMKAEGKNLKSMRTWAETELPEGRDSSATLWYAFSGPDYLYANTFFPAAKKYVMFGLEPTGKVPDLSSRADYSGLFKSIQRSLISSLSLNFFITKDMMQDLRKDQEVGVLSLLMLFSAYTGHKILDIDYLYIDPEGTPVLCSYDSAKSSGYTTGVQMIVLDSLNREKELIYLSFNAENSAFDKNTGLQAYFNNLDGTIYGMLKAASYLMHYDGFKSIRELYLPKLTTLLSDDTGIKYTKMTEAFDKVQLYGTYSQPIDLFDYINIDDLRQAYKENTAKDLPFTYGYGFGKKVMIGRK